MTMPRRKKVTLRELAAELGLTVHTVSKALRGLPGMSEETRKAVFLRARELGYRTKAQEAGLTAERLLWVGGPPRRFGMLLDGTLDFHRHQLEGAQKRLNELDCALHPLLVPPGIAGEAALEQWLAANGVPYMDGVFLTATLPEWMEEPLMALPMPKVLLNYPPAAALVDSVIWDVEHAVHQSMEALYRKGHRSVLYIGDKGPHRGFRLRWQAFLDAAGRLGIKVAEDTGTTMRRGQDQTRWLQELGEQLASGTFTCVLSAIPDTATWVYMSAASRRLSVPEDFSLVSIENAAVPHLPDLSRPILFQRETGERAAELMLRRIANPLLPYEHVRLRGPFHEGETLRTIRVSDV
jgi:LacI family transcriptional regulator